MGLPSVGTLKCEDKANNDEIHILRSLAHMYNMEQSIVFRCTLCDRKLPNSKKQRDLISENTAHLLSTAVQLLCDCYFSGL